MTIDFGFNSPCTGTMGDFVWHDLNRNGLQDPGEPGLNGVRVWLRNAAGQIIAQATTATNPRVDRVLRVRRPLRRQLLR